MQAQDIQRKKHCDHCHLAFGLKEKREPFGDMAVHKEPCLAQLERAVEQRQTRVGHPIPVMASRFDRR